MKATIVFKRNWDAIHKECDECNGTGLVADISCGWCGDGSSKLKKGSGKHYRHIVNRGSSRSSKTHSLIQLYDLYARTYYMKRCTVWRDTKTDCKKTVLNDMMKYLKTTGLYKLSQDFNKTESIFSYDTESTVEIHGTDDEETVHGLTQDLAWLNEPYKVGNETFNQIDQRTSDFVFIDYNPKKGHWVEDVIKKKRTLVIDSTFKDNPFCPIEQKNKILSYQPIDFSKAVMNGILTKEEAKEYNLTTNVKNLTKGTLKELIRCQENESNNSASSFNWQVYGLGLKAERPNRIFSWSEIPDSDFHKLDIPEYIGNDWGNVDPWAIVKAKYKDGCLYVHELNYDSENVIRERLTLNERTQAGLTSNNELQNETGLVTYMYAKLNISKKIPIICDTNRPLKIAALSRAGYNSFGANKPKGSINDGIDILSGLKVYYTSSSKNIAHEQENYSRKVDRHGVILEEPEDLNNHTMDAIRYVALYLMIRGVIKLV